MVIKIFCQFNEKAVKVLRNGSPNHADISHETAEKFIPFYERKPLELNVHIL